MIECEECGGEHERQQLPVWKFSWWDIGGFVILTWGNIFSVIGNGCVGISREFFAAANYGRQEKELMLAQQRHTAAQREIAQNLKALVDGPEEKS